MDAAEESPIVDKCFNPIATSFLIAASTLAFACLLFVGLAEQETNPNKFSKFVVTLSTMLAKPRYLQLISDANFSYIKMKLFIVLAHGLSLDFFIIWCHGIPLLSYCYDSCE